MTTTPLIIDPEFASLCPPLTPDELKHLEASIKAEGCHDALKVWKGHNTVIDGHNRFSICLKHGKGHAVKYIDLPDRNAVIEWIIRNQFGRRNLTAGQRAELALKLKPVLAEQAKARQGTRTDLNFRENSPRSSPTREALADAAGVSTNTIDKTAKVLAEGDDATKQALHEGRMTVNAAYEETFPEPPPAPKPKKEKSPADAPKDEKGNVLPAKLLPAFAAGDEIAAVMGKLSALKGQVLKSAAEGDGKLWEHFNVSQFAADLDNARNLLKRVKPYAICPYCQAGERGSGTHCGKDGCEGKGWVDFFRWQTTPKEMK